MWKTEWYTNQRYTLSYRQTHTNGKTCTRARTHPSAPSESEWSLAFYAYKQVVDWTFIPTYIHTNTLILTHTHTHTSGGGLSSHAVWICIKAET